MASSCRACMQHPEQLASTSGTEGSVQIFNRVDDGIDTAQAIEIALPPRFDAPPCRQAAHRVEIASMGAARLNTRWPA